VVAAALGLLLAVTAAMVWEGGTPPSPLRHLYLVPVVWAALHGGARAGGVLGLMAGFVQVPLVLPAIERAGLTGSAVEGLVSLAMPPAAGVLAGLLRDQSRARARRLSALLEVERCLSREEPLAARLDAVAAVVRGGLSAARVGVLVGMSTEAAALGSVPAGATLGAGSAAAWALSTGRSVRSQDLGTDRRFTLAGSPAPTPRRGLILPMDAGAGSVGVLALEWRGEVATGTAAAAAEFALHLALGVENARLTLRQRRFAEELEDKVAAATRRLREIDQAKSEFLTVVSHELRTPLTALEGFAELLLTRAVPPERAARFLRHIHVEAQRLGRIVAELLDVSRLEVGVAPDLKREPLELAAHVERQIELFAGVHPAHRFHWEAEGARPPLLADRDALDRILQNLLSNAVKYSPRGGEVRVSARAAADRFVELRVEDQGVGIPAAELPRIFDKYVRIANQDTASVRGLGLGLSLVRALVEAHGGRIEVESEPGTGSVFRVFLPA
jgi:signal transduction histidine kinase